MHFFSGEGLMVDWAASCSVCVCVRGYALCCLQLLCCELRPRMKKGDSLLSAAIYLAVSHRSPCVTYMIVEDGACFVVEDRHHLGDVCASATDCVVGFCFFL